MASCRPARLEDLPAVVALVSEGDQQMEDGHVAAFHSIEGDERNEMFVLDEDGVVLGCLQITYIPGLGRGGAERAHLEAVRVRPDRRGEGLGGDLVRFAIDRARERGCGLVQLTSNKRRVDAHRFYESLGFEQNHEGLKLILG
jgi:GNAT superfamily N-acetyltransferase